MKNLTQISFKSGVDPKDIFHFTKLARILFVEVMQYFRDNNLELVVTSLRSDRMGINTASTTHEDGRAFDVRIRNLCPWEVENIVDHFNDQFSNLGAYSIRSGLPVTAHLEKDHIHFQVRRS